MNLAVLPARGGSRRIPRKNVRDFCGKPMIAWPIRAALESGCFDRVVVSTDDEEISAVAQAVGAEVPFRRPPDLSDDHAATRPVIAHAIEYMRQKGMTVTNVCCLYATAAFTSPAAIRSAYETLIQSGASYVFPILPFPAPIERSLRQSESGHIEMVMPEHFATRSQDLQQAWHDAGQFYWAKADTWLADKPIFSPDAVGLPLPADAACDIDYEEDWVKAEDLFKLKSKR